MSRENWSNVFRVALTLDSAIFACKFALTVWLVVYGIRDRTMVLYGRDKVESESAVTAYFRELGLFLESGFFVIIIFFRLFANVNQYNNEKRSSASKNLCKYFNCGCCKTSCWYIVSLLHFLMDGILIMIDWTYNRWLTKVAISYLSWEMFIFLLSTTYKSLFIEETANHVVDLPNRQRADNQEASPPYQSVDLPNRQRNCNQEEPPPYLSVDFHSKQINDEQEEPPPYQLYASNEQQIN